MKKGSIIGEGVNRVTRDLDPTAHAEVSAIRRTCRVLSDFDLAGCEIYTSCEPCPMCLGAIYWARLDRIYYAATREDAAAAGFDDEKFYRELAAPLGERQTPLIPALREEGARPFQAWRDFSAKVTY